MLIVAGVVGGIVAGAVWWKRRGDSAPEAVETAMVEKAASTASGSHRFAKFIEVSGFRITEERQKPVIKMLVTNHSAGDLGGVDLNVTVKATDGKQLGTVEFRNVQLGPYGFAEVSAPFKSKLRAYEMPDWQFVRADFEITSQ
jgi:hypothetical protein